MTKRQRDKTLLTQAITLMHELCHIRQFLSGYEEKVQNFSVSQQLYMNIVDELQNIDLNSPLGQMIYNSQEFNSFDIDSGFIQETLNVLESENLAHKKSYFIDNQVYVTDSLNNMNRLLKLLEDNIGDQNSDANLSRLLQVVGMTIKKLERGIDKFQQELVGQVSSKTVNEKISVSKDTIKEAMQSNENTMQIAKDLKDPSNIAIDDKTAEIQENFKEYYRELKAQKKMEAQQQQNQPQLRYLITSTDLQEVRFVQNVSKNMLNTLLQNCGIDNARVFELKEVPTKKKTIQKTVTVIN